VVSDLGTPQGTRQHSLHYILGLLRALVTLVTRELKYFSRIKQ
jgi:hypothetical protein